MSHPASESRQWQHIQQILFAQKAEINRAIREYPLPITACDDQFNYLLEKRSAITQELGRFNRMSEEGSTEENGGEVPDRDAALEMFVADSQFVDEGILHLAEAG